MERIAGGDKPAFQQLTVRHLPRAHAIARRMLLSPEDAEEAVQDAFSKLWVHAARFDPGKAAFSTWFYRILSNACLNMARVKLPAFDPIGELAESLADNATEHDNALAALQEAERIRQAVASLPERQRMAVVLCYFEDMTNPEAAAIMGLHIKALEGLLARARKKLKQYLE